MLRSAQSSCSEFKKKCSEYLESGRAVAKLPVAADSSQASGTMAALSSVASPHVLSMNTSGRKTDR